RLVGVVHLVTVRDAHYYCCLYIHSQHYLLLITLFNFSFFFNDTATTEIYTLSLHDALPISPLRIRSGGEAEGRTLVFRRRQLPRSEEHTSELQSLAYLVCRLLLEKKKHSKRAR